MTNFWFSSSQKYQKADKMFHVLLNNNKISAKRNPTVRKEQLSESRTSSESLYSYPIKSDHISEVSWVKKTYAWARNTQSDTHTWITPRFGESEKDRSRCDLITILLVLKLHFKNLICLDMNRMHEYFLHYISM